ncbi:hypothetical protein BH10PSE7_BH10PSE7_15330 [soil metagenome]
MGVLANAARDLWEAGLSGEQLFAALAIFEDMLASLAPDDLRPARMAGNGNALPRVAGGRALSMTRKAVNQRRYRANQALRQVAMDGNAATVPATGVAVARIPLSLSKSLKEGNSSLLLRELDSESTLFETATPVTPVAANIRRLPYPADFEEFWQAYPTDEGMSKKKAFAQYRRLSVGDRAKALDVIPQFKAWVGRQRSDYTVLHAVRYLSERRFEGFAEKTARVTAAAGMRPVQIFIATATDQFRAWAKYRNETMHKSTPSHNGGWWFDSEWPPEPARRKEAG